MADAGWVDVIPVEGAGVPKGCQSRLKLYADSEWGPWEPEINPLFTYNDVRWYKDGEYQARMPVPKPSLTMPMPDAQWKSLTRKEQSALLQPFEDAWDRGEAVEYLNPHDGKWYVFDECYQMRLKPKPVVTPKTVWVTLYPGNCMGCVYASEEDAKRNVEPSGIVRKFIEVSEGETAHE